MGRGITTHGHTVGYKPTREYKSWTQMRRRCRNPAAHNYSHYGGRGITICTRWDAFENFSVDMGRRPEGTSLDRINCDGNYEPTNCRWATVLEQRNNRRDNQMLTLNGVTKTISDWSRLVGLQKATVWARINNLGWSVDNALNVPVGVKPRRWQQERNAGRAE